MDNDYANFCHDAPAARRHVIALGGNLRGGYCEAGTHFHTGVYLR